MCILVPSECFKYTDAAVSGDKAGASASASWSACNQTVHTVPAVLCGILVQHKGGKQAVKAEALSGKKSWQVGFESGGFVREETCDSALGTLTTLAAGVLSTGHYMCLAWSAWLMSGANTHIFHMQNVSKEAEKTAGNIADAAPQIADRVSDRLVKEADQVGREVKPAADKAAKRLSSEADQLGKEARPMADKASANIEAGARQAGEQARPAADKASDAMKKGANDASGEQRDTHCDVHYAVWLCKLCCCWLCTLSIAFPAYMPVCAQPCFLKGGQTCVHEQ